MKEQVTFNNENQYNKKKEGARVNRRTFLKGALKGAAAILGGSVVSGCGPQLWDEQLSPEKKVEIEKSIEDLISENITIHDQNKQLSHQQLVEARDKILEKIPNAEQLVNDFSKKLMQFFPEMKSSIGLLMSFLPMLYQYMGYLPNKKPWEAQSKDVKDNAKKEFEEDLTQAFTRVESIGNQNVQKALSEFIKSIFIYSGAIYDKEKLYKILNRLSENSLDSNFLLNHVSHHVKKHKFLGSFIDSMQNLKDHGENIILSHLAYLISEYIFENETIDLEQDKERLENEKRVKNGMPLVLDKNLTFQTHHSYISYVTNQSIYKTSFRDFLKPKVVPMHEKRTEVKRYRTPFTGASMYYALLYDNPNLTLEQKLKLHDFSSNQEDLFSQFDLTQTEAYTISENRGWDTKGLVNLKASQKELSGVKKLFSEIDFRVTLIDNDQSARRIFRACQCLYEHFYLKKKANKHEYIPYEQIYTL